MKTKTKNRNKTFYSHEFIHFIADLIDPLSIFHILVSNIYIYIYIYIYICIYIYIYLYVYIYVVYIYIYIYLLLIYYLL